MNGAAAASALSFAISSALFFHYGHKIAGFSTPASIYRLFAIGIVICALLFLAKPAIAYAASLLPSFGGAGLSSYVNKGEYLFLMGIAAAASAVLFAALSLVFKCFEHEDIVMMRKAAKKAFVPEKLIVFSEKILVLGVEGKK